MHYVMSDLHGCYREYRKALQKIHFSDKDMLFVVGDVIDRGQDSIKLLQDMMYRDNVIPLAGNHEYMASELLPILCADGTDKNADPAQTRELMGKFQQWIGPENGGAPTVEGFRALSEDDKEDILDYLDEFLLYEELTVDGKDFLLVHGGLEPFVPKKSPEDYTAEQLLCSRADFSRRYFPDEYVITGHTLTPAEPGHEGKIIRKNGHIGIDCGCVYGFQLGVLCLETGAMVYVPSGEGSR